MGGVSPTPASVYLRHDVCAKGDGCLLYKVQGGFQARMGAGCQTNISFIRESRENSTVQLNRKGVSPGGRSPLKAFTEVSYAAGAANTH